MWKVEIRVKNCGKWKLGVTVTKLYVFIDVVSNLL